MSPKNLNELDFAKAKAFWDKFVDDKTKEREIDREFHFSLAKYIVKNLSGV